MRPALLAQIARLLSSGLRVEPGDEIPYDTEHGRCRCLCTAADIRDAGLLPRS